MNKINERLGVNSEVERVSKEIFEHIKKDIQKNNVLQIFTIEDIYFIINGKKFNFNEVTVNYQDTNETTGIPLKTFTNTNRRFTIILTKTSINLINIQHEVTHVYEKTVKMLNNKPYQTISTENIYNLTRKYKNNLLYKIYFLDKGEMNAFMHELYVTIKDTKNISNKKIFENTIRKTHIYEEIESFKTLNIDDEFEKLNVLDKDLLNQLMVCYNVKTPEALKNKLNIFFQKRLKTLVSKIERLNKLLEERSPKPTNFFTMFTNFFKNLIR